MFLDKYIKQLEKERKATVRDLRGLATSQAVEEIKLLEQNKLLKRVIKELKAVKEFVGEIK